MTLSKLPRFYPILNIETLERRGADAVSAARQMLDAGVSILQFRAKGWFTNQTFDELERISDLCRRAGATLVVNDRADIAKMIGAGLHLGQHDLRPREARAMVGRAALIGFSTHNESQIRQAMEEPADYVAFGPIFGTGSKANPDPVVGIEGLRRIRALLSKPLVAIGGITRSNAGSVMEAGADAVAVIGDVCAAEDIGARTKEWLDILKLSY
ncbi:MAG TPA: thiamine phosphate synthase [Bryobacteraceae bacterium]|nr:thiamine phosphate synthase [Bryobacteraceae bacterium]